MNLYQSYEYMNKKHDFSASLLAELDALYRTARYLTSDGQLAEDIVQEVAMKAIRSSHTFRAELDFRPWIFTILRNTIKDYYRHQKRQPQTFSLADDEVGLPVYEGPDESFFQNVLDEKIEDALAQLPEEMRLAILLVDVEGFSYQELAQTLDWPLGTVMSRLYRGRRHLKKLLRNVAENRGYVYKR